MTIIKSVKTAVKTEGFTREHTHMLNAREWLLLYCTYARSRSRLHCIYAKYCGSSDGSLVTVVRKQTQNSVCISNSHHVIERVSVGGDAVGRV